MKEQQVMGASGTPDRAAGPSDLSRFASSQSSIPSAEDPANDPLFRVRLVKNGVERTLATLLQHRCTTKDPKAGGFNFAEVPDWALRQWHEDLCVAAQAIEARRAETQSGSVHESAVGNADAPKESRDA